MIKNVILCTLTNVSLFLQYVSEINLLKHMLMSCARKQYKCSRVSLRTA